MREGYLLFIFVRKKRHLGDVQMWDVNCRPVKSNISSIILIALVVVREGVMEMVMCSSLINTSARESVV